MLILIKLPWITRSILHISTCISLNHLTNQVVTNLIYKNMELFNHLPEVSEHVTLPKQQEVFQNSWMLVWEEPRNHDAIDVTERGENQSQKLSHFLKVFRTGSRAAFPGSRNSPRAFLIVAGRQNKWWGEEHLAICVLGCWTAGSDEHIHVYLLVMLYVTICAWVRSNLNTKLLEVFLAFSSLGLSRFWI